MNFFSKIIDTIHTDFKEHIVKVGIVLGILATVYLISENIFVSFIIAAIVAVVLLRWDSRIFFVFGLIFLIFCPFLLAFEKKTVAEDMAVYAYYMLALGVIMQIVHHVRESIEEAKKAKKRKRVSAHEYWTKKKLALWSVGIALVTLSISGGCFYFFYSKIQKELKSNAKEVLEMAQKSQVQTNFVTTTETEASSMKPPEVLEVIDEPGDWETVKVFVVNTTEQKGLENKVADEFKKLGCLNVFPSQVTSTAQVVTTTVDYCSDCFNVAEELGAGLPFSKGLILNEQTTFENQITVQLGTDQLPVKK